MRTYENENRKHYYVHSLTIKCDDNNNYDNYNKTKAHVKVYIEFE